LTDANLDWRLRLKLVNLFCSSYLQLVQNSRTGGAQRPDGSANRHVSVEGTGFVNWRMRCQTEAGTHEVKTFDRVYVFGGQRGIRANSFSHQDWRRLRPKLLCTTAGVLCSCSALLPLPWLQSRVGRRRLLG